MYPPEYLEYLERCRKKEGLAKSDLRPCSAADVMSVERETGVSLPEEYVDFLCQVGAGEEHNGLACWYHLDITRPGNVVNHSHVVMTEQIQAMREAGVPVTRYPKNMLLIHDPCDGVIYGFVPNSGSTYKPGVYCWDLEEFELEQISECFGEFLEYLTKANPC